MFEKTITETDARDIGGDALLSTISTFGASYQSSVALSLLHGLFEISPDAIYLKDGEGHWLAANAPGLAVFHLSKDHYQGKTDAELAALAHPFYRDALLSCRVSDEQTWARGTLLRAEEVIPLPDGGGLVFDVIKMPLFNHDGSRRGLMVLGRDITESREAEVNLTNRSAILDALISSDWLLHSTVSWQRVAPEILSLLGASAIYSRLSLFKVSAGENSSFYAERTHYWSAPECMPFPEQYLAFDFESVGCANWPRSLLQGHPVFGAAAKFSVSEMQFLQQLGTSAIVVIPIFVDDDWWGMLMVERCNQACEISPQELGAFMAAGRSFGVAIQRETSGARLRQAMIAFESAAEGIFITDDQARLIAINCAYTEILGYREEDVLGRLPGQLNPDVLGAEMVQQLMDGVEKDGRWRGQIENLRKNGKTYPEWLTLTVAKDHDGRVTNYVGVFADMSDAKQAQDKLQEMVNRDALTNLPNRRLLNELMEHAIKRAERDKCHVATLFIDLDRFKVINDTLGHQVGDKLLIEVSERLSSIMRESDTVSRLGGDEFVVMMDSLRDVEDASRVAKKIVSSLQTVFMIDGKEVFIGASVGISLYPQDGDDVGQLIKSADIAMYQVKSEGKNNHRFYSADLSENAVERFNMESQLRRALERHQFEIYYQPQVSLMSGRIVGAEALVRWQHPELGVVAPSKFIPLAEETGMVVQIGEWVLREAVKQVVAWGEQGLKLPSISVNVSGVQVQRSNFADTVYSILVETGCEPSLLELEVTESVVMHNTEQVISVFNRIREPGVRLAIDDFGTGYSSLSYLKRLPLDKLKIDQTFVRDLTIDDDDKAIASAVIALAHSLSLKVIAEGVESAEQVDTLTAMGCEDAQGFLFGSPVPAADFAQMLIEDAKNN